MILPPRGQSVDTDLRAEIRKALKSQVAERRIEQSMDADQMRLSAIFSDDDIHQLYRDLDIKFRQRNSGNGADLRS